MYWAPSSHSTGTEVVDEGKTWYKQLILTGIHSSIGGFSFSPAFPKCWWGFALESCVSGMHLAHLYLPRADVSPIPSESSPDL